MKQMLSAVAMLLSAAPLFGIDAVWNNPSATTQFWKYAANWNDAATGKTATSAPVAVGDTATFGDPSAQGIEQQTVSTGRSNYSGPATANDGVDPVVDAVSGDYHTVIQHTTTRPSDSGKVRRYFTLADGSGFWGWWLTSTPWSTFVLNGDSAEASMLSSLSLFAKPVVSVPEAKAGRIASVYRGGMLVKEGEGDLSVGATTGSDTILRMEGGSATFEGRAATAEALLARAATGASVAGAREVFAAGDWTAAPFTLSDDAARGESTLDGQPVGASACKPSALSGYHFVSVALPAGVTVTRTAQASGETVVFTESLTRAERQVVNTYLRAKWGARSAVDAGTVFLTESANVLGVSSNATARLGEVVLLSGSAIEKKGDGVLELTRTVPATAPVKVTGGGIGIANVSPAGDISKPAASPWLWLDANRTDTMTLDGTSVTAWRDCRTGAVTATFDNALCSEAPKLSDDANLRRNYQDGTNVVCFAIGKACLKLPNWQSATPNAYSVFYVARAIGSSGQWTTPLVGSSDANAFLRNAKNFRSEEGLSVFSKTARWTVNGDPVDPQEDNQPFISDNSNYHVVSFSASEPFLTDAILRSGSAAASAHNCGGLYIGEYLVYDRELTPAERRDTEAYLLRKWKLSYVHKGDSACIASAAFASGIPVVLSSSATGAVAAVSGGNGALVKKGSGTLYVSTPLTNATSVTVEAGELKAGFGFDDALFHFDASDYASLETQIVDGEDGAKVTNVIHWADVRRNGAYAHYRYHVSHNAYVENDYVKQPPTYHAATTAEEVERPVVDFGELSLAQATVTNASGMKLDRDYANVREAIVFGRTVTWNTKPVWLFGANGGYDAQYGQWTCGDWNIFRNDTPAEILDGYFAIDGVETVGKSTRYPQEYACYDAGPTGDTFINALAIQKFHSPGFVGGTAGGWRICETMAFSRNLTAAERAYLAAKLRYKWQGAGMKPVWTNQTALASIHVAAGATLTDLEETHLDVARLSGGGTVNCGELAGVSALALDGSSTLTVNGTLLFAASGTVAVDCRGAATDEKLPLLQANAIEGLDLSKWTVSGTKSRTVKLSLEGNALFGIIRKPGLMLLVR